VAERLRQSLAETVVPAGGKALYAAKNTGRNKVRAAAHG
jgi:PleD family two-component response regulator